MKPSTLREVASALKVSEKTIRRLINRGDLVGFRGGDRGLVRLKSEDFEDYMNRQRVHVQDRMVEKTKEEKE